MYSRIGQGKETGKQHKEQRPAIHRRAESAREETANQQQSKSQQFTDDEPKVSVKKLQNSTEQKPTIHRRTESDRKETAEQQRTESVPVKKLQNSRAKVNNSPTNRKCPSTFSKTQLVLVSSR